MEDVLNQDMIDAINSIDINSDEKEILRNILFHERTNKDREWDDEAVDVIIKLLETDGKAP